MTGIFRLTAGQLLWCDRARRMRAARRFDAVSGSEGKIMPVFDVGDW